jgi:gliding motility-associated lipoprotein GldD
MKMKNNNLNLILFAFLVFSCHDANYSPKPRGYFRIDFPKKEYKLYEGGNCPFKFEYPEYASVDIDSDRDAQPCWLNVQFRSLNGTLHLSYKEIKENLYKYTEDSRSLTDRHMLKASAIDETPIKNISKHLYGLKYNIEGNTASAVQFYITDSVHHFLRGSLYFNLPPQIDSLEPVIRFVESDIDHLINTFSWK